MKRPNHKSYFLALSTFLLMFCPPINATEPNSKPKAMPRPDCESVLVGPLAHIFREMENEQVTTSFVEPENISSFLNQCSLVSAIYVAEAMNRLSNPNNKLGSLEWLERGRELLPALKKATLRKETGLNLYETQALAKYLARTLGLATVQFQATTEVSKKFMPTLDSDLTIIGTRVIGEANQHHMIVGYHFSENRLLAMDPLTGTSATYDVVFLSEGVIHLSNLTRTTGPARNLSISSAVKVMMMHERNLPGSTDILLQLNLLHQKLIDLTKLLRDPYPLIHPKFLGNDPERAGSIVHDLFEAFEEAKEITQRVNPASLPNLSEAAAVFELRLRYLEIEDLKKSTGTIEWLEARGFLEPDPNKKTPPVTLGQNQLDLESELSEDFKSKRKLAIDAAMQLFEKGKIDRDDIIFNLRRAMNPYEELLLEINKTLPPKDAHRALSSLYAVLKKLMTSNFVNRELDDFDSTFSGFVRTQWLGIQKSREKFNLD